MSTDALPADPLLCLRQSIALKTTPILATTPESTNAADAEASLAKATHIEFNTTADHRAFALDTPTRFIPAAGESAGRELDLRSVFFSWQNKDVAIQEYIAAIQKLNAELSESGGAGGKVHNLVFVEKLDLNTWLEGAAQESEYIKPLAAEEAAAQAAQDARIAAGTTGAPVAAKGGEGIGGALGQRAPAKTVDPRLQEIYNGERRMGDRNSVLRGIKPTDFSHIRKSAELFLGRNKSRAAPAAPANALNPSSGLVPNSRKPGRRPEPIILLSPSASSLLRMTNIKSFLVDGVFTPDSTSLSSSTGASILHVSRLLPSISSHPLRFILVDTPDQFKPDYWSRVVAVFTTGQAWQFRGYKWANPPELFSHALGIYVGWKGEVIPDTVRGWGRSVVKAEVDKWNPHIGTAGRWRDREVVESIWLAIEESMRAKGWNKESAGIR